MKYIIFAIFLLGILLSLTSSHRMSFYRTDYKYFEDFDAFYKIHWDDSAASWKTAFNACADEGATLFYPRAEGEWTLVKNLSDSATDVLNATDIFVGFHDDFKLGEFITVDGRSLPGPLASDTSLQPNRWATSYYSGVLADRRAFGRNFSPFVDYCITMNIDSGLFKVGDCHRTPDTGLPFVCKKVEEKSCPTIDRGYKYMKASRKCYKVNKKQKLWQEAMKTCFIEGGILTVIENKAQAEEVLDMLELELTYFVGVRKIVSRDSTYKSTYYTVKGKKFSEMYQNPDQHRLSSGQDWDNYREYGTVRKQDNYLYTDTATDTERLPFICEMEVAL